MIIDLESNLQKVVCQEIAVCIADFVMRDRLTFYGYFLQNVNFYKTEKISTAGVNFVGLKMNFYYNEEFIKDLSIKQIKFICIHELFHLLFNHPTRGKGYVHKIANFSMDMIINEIILEEHCKKIISTDGQETVLHDCVAEWVPGIVKMDSNFNGERIFEIAYAWTNEKYNLWKEMFGEEEKDRLIEKMSSMTSKEFYKYLDNISKKPLTEQRIKENKKLGIDEYTRRFFENNLPSFDTHFWDDIPDEIKEKIVQNHIDDIRQAGHITSNEENVIGKLRKKGGNDLLRLLKRNISDIKGFTKMNSFKKPSRKGIDGLKGRVKYSNCINCLLDTSGSMIGNFETVVSEIFKDDYKINMIQCDSEVKNYKTLTSKKQIQEMKLVGLGGTTLQPGIDFVLSNRDLRKNNLVILTDGITDVLDFSKCGGMKILILSANKECPLKKKFANVKQIIVKAKN